MNKEPQLSLPSATLSQAWLVQGRKGSLAAPRYPHSPGEPGRLQAQPAVDGKLTAETSHGLTPAVGGAGNPSSYSSFASFSLCGLRQVTSPL